jgi:hypothetical protein
MAYCDRIRGGLADKRRPRDFNSQQLQAGVRVEREHTSDKKLAREIAMDHLTEDPAYYLKLKQIEKAFKPTGASKTQAIRLADVYLVGPVMIWGGIKLTPEHPVLGPLLVVFGAATITYNGRNYLRIRAAR